MFRSFGRAGEDWLRFVRKRVGAKRIRAYRFVSMHFFISRCFIKWALVVITIKKLARHAAFRSHDAARGHSPG